MQKDTPLLQLQGISKAFGPLLANDNIDLELYRGEILALLGENGAGKTTLMNILFGHYIADEGSITIDGTPLSPGSPKAALRAGLGMVHQHFTLADNMTVLDNIMLGTEPIFALARKKRLAAQKIKALTEQYEIDVNPKALIKNLSVGQRQRVEILKALYRDTSILILDEPTAVLTPQESDHLFATLRLLVQKGLAVILISHKMHEVMRVSDRCMVLRHGKKIHQCKTAETSADQLARAMVGGELPAFEKKATTFQAPLLTLNNISASTKTGSYLRELSLTLHSGEILGIAGVSGNGQSHLANLISGLLTPSSGTMIIEGETMTKLSPMEMLKKGVGRIPEDRNSTGIIGDMTVLENVAIEKFWKKAYSRFGLLNFKNLASHSLALLTQFDVRCGGIDSPARAMSGGNMQKLILARALSEKPRIIIANQPTWGLDVGATAFVHRQLLEASRNGAGVIIISEDLDELFKVADTLQVMYQGSLSRPLDPSQTTAEEVGLAMSGQHTMISSAAVLEAGA